MDLSEDAEPEKVPPKKRNRPKSSDKNAHSESDAPPKKRGRPRKSESDIKPPEKKTSEAKMGKNNSEDSEEKTPEMEEDNAVSEEESLDQSDSEFIESPKETPKRKQAEKKVGDVNDTKLRRTEKKRPSEKISSP